MNGGLRASAILRETGQRVTREAVCLQRFRSDAYAGPASLIGQLGSNRLTEREEAGAALRAIADATALGRQSSDLQSGPRRGAGECEMERPSPAVLAMRRAFSRTRC